MSTKFTNDLPPDDAFGAEANFIVIHPERGEIWSPCSSRQINAERFGFAARGGQGSDADAPSVGQGILDLRA